MQYGGWLIGGMDMATIFVQFNGEPIKFLHHTFESSFDEESLMQIQKEIKEANCVFHYFLFPEKDAYNSSAWWKERFDDNVLPRWSKG